ncbi:mitochondrial processing peptidase alpha subunit [Trypanosoma rangeli]|uniref:Mitochondrial processing peptidase alpha subunit n=1 Tax=Trypanosoma rangeli TaxID=5698 RepID=A0A3R7JXS6_TRYRA|nr:mitochondrial processing peptidase alpha subunit [Trypanosoma rangeli]RNE98565.1 mitochondrial processing peptidase alpha subunit [Trypanosoma rangeli]|eukprot:RNE98565.1 mitochondrial processing peptidase alpha subunit [Trypanosoma rangeli]
MLRRTRSRAISQYNFGQPSLTRAFGPIPCEGQTAKAGKVMSTKLSNGVRVVSHDLDGAHSVVGVYVNAGPKYDPLSCPGLSHVMRYAIQTSNMDSSLFQVDRTMRSTGNAYGHGEICKRYVHWKAEGRRDMWEHPFAMLATGVVAPRFHESDVERFRDTMDNQREELRWQHPREYCVDALETVAFFREPLASPRMVPPEANDRCNQKALVDHWAKHFHPGNVTLAAVNVPHNALLAAYASLPYPHSAEAPHHARSRQPTFSHASEATQFYPGRQRVVYEDRAKAMGTVPDMGQEVIAALGVPTFGCDEDVKKYATALVAREVYQASIDRAMPAALATSQGVQSFYRPYSSAGLLGVTIRGAPEEVENLLAAARGSFPTKVTEDEAAAGRARATMAFTRNHLEMVRDYCDFIATSSATPQQLLGAIGAVSAGDVDAALGAAGAVAPAVFVTGSTFAFPRVSSLRREK